MKKYLFFLVAIMFATTARADWFLYQGIAFSVISEEEHTARVERNRFLSGDITIPSYAIKGETQYSVTVICDYAFLDCSDMTSVTIPNTVSAIGWGAFSKCESLASIIVEDGNSYYTSVDGVLFNIDKTTLIQCPGGKTEYVIPNSVSAISAYAFYENSNLSSLTIPDSVTEIGAYAFYVNSNLLSLTIPDSVTEIGECAFRNCLSLTEINISDSLTKIGREVFAYCTSLTNVNIPGSVTEIGDGAFSGCRSLTSVTIPDSVTEIGDGAFENCSSLTSVTIPDSVTEIGDGAFENCSSLTSVTIPDSVTEIGGYAFAGCNSLTSIIIEEGNPNYFSENGGLFNKDKTILIQCYGAQTEYIIPGSVTEIGEGAFAKCSALISVVIPKSVTVINSFAFWDCSSLTSIDIPDSVSEIGEEVFAFCSSLAEVIIPNSVTEISARAFYECSSLVSVNIPNSVTEIGTGAFYFCTGLTSVIIPNSVTEIGESAFNTCSGLTSVIIPNSVTEIGTGAFHRCNSLASVNIPSGVNHIADNTFGFCSNLRTIYNQNPVPQSVGNRALSSVPNECTVYVPKGSIKDYSVATGWNRFSDFREMGAFDIVLSEHALELVTGETATITTSVTKDDNMTVASEEWISSKPKVATVDNGVITAVAPGEAVIYFTAVDGYGVPHTGSCTVTVIEYSGTDAVISDTAALADVFNLQGFAVLRSATYTEIETLPAGFYIVRLGKSVKKIIVK